MLFDLLNVPFDRKPPADLDIIYLRDSSAHEIAAIPLEPSAGVFGKYPAFSSPLRQRLARVDLKIIQRSIMLFRAKLGFFKPIRRKLLFAVCHVFAAKNAKAQHLFWIEFGFKSWVEILSDSFNKLIPIALLHLIMDRNHFF